MSAPRLLSVPVRTAFGLLAAGALLAAAPQSAAGDFPYSEGYVDGAEFEFSRTVVPGVQHYFESREVGPLTISTVTVETGREDLIAEPRSGQDDIFGRETLLDMVERLYDPEARPVAAINADFWAAGGVAIGLLVLDGTIWRQPNWRDRDPDIPSRSVFALNEDDDIYIGATDLQIRLHGPEGSEPLSIRAVNFPLDEGGNTLFTWPRGDEAPEPEEGYLAFAIGMEDEELLPNTTTAGTIDGEPDSGSLALGRTRVVVHAEEPLPDWVEPDAAVELEIVFPELSGRIVSAIGGGPLILQDGENVAEERNHPEGWSNTFRDTRHPRTAIGLKEDGRTIVAMVVDGRQPARSRGISLQDLSDLMAEKGAVIAMNLDGGGSSTMVVDGELSNFPSDSGGARAVTNAIVFRRLGPIGELSGLELQPGDLRLPPGASHNVRIRGISSDGERYPLDGSPWSIILTSPDGVLTPYRHLAPGRTNATVRARHTGTTTLRAAASRRTVDASHPQPSGGLRATVEEAASLSFQPPAMLLEPGQSLPVRLLAESTSGEPFSPHFFFEDMDLPEFLAWSGERGEVEALGRGAGHIRVRTGSAEAALPVAVSQFNEVPLISFDELPPQGIDLLNAYEDRSSLTLNHENARVGDTSWRLRYALERDGTSRVGIPLNIELPSDHPMALGAWVYGDGRRQWMRATLSDADGRTIYGDFTDEQTGIDWEGEWRHLRLDLQTAAPAGTMTPPYRLNMVYLIQLDPERKGEGEILLDGLALLELPEEL